MAVHERQYRPWDGRPTTYLRRMLVVPRFALMGVLSSRAVLALLLVGMLPALLLAGAVWFSANFAALQAAIPPLRELDSITVGPELYQLAWRIQDLPVFLLTVIAGPPLIASDVANNALPLYFSKALRRSDYILGKALVLILLLSAASVVPLTLTYVLQWAMYGARWRAENGWLLGSILLMGSLHVALLCSTILAISAYVRRARDASIALVALMMVTPGVARALDSALDSRVGEVVSPAEMLNRVAEWAFLEPERRPVVAPPPRQDLGAVHWSQQDPVGVEVALGALATWIAASIVVVARKIRPVEVVR